MTETNRIMELWRRHGKLILGVGVFSVIAILIGEIEVLNRLERHPRLD